MPETFAKAILALLQQDIRTIPREAADLFLNILAVALSGAENSSVDIAAAYLQEECPGSYHPLGREESLSPYACAMLDCFSSAIHAYDDIHFETTLHPAGPIFSALLAEVRKEPVSLQAYLEAFLIGMEAECRFARYLFSNGSSSWYTTGIAGGLGAAAAIARLRHFDESTAASAIAYGAAKASGIRGTHGSMTGSFVPSFAAGAGYEGAALAQKGFTCSLDAIDGRSGLLTALNPKPSLRKALEGIGEEWICLKTSTKPYPLGFISLAPLNCVDQLPPLTEIEEAVMTVSPTAAMLGGKPVPQNTYDGFVSLRWLTARAILKKISLHDPLPEDLEASEEEKKLARKITVYADEQFAEDQARLEVLADGRWHIAYCEAPKGCAANPMNHEDILRKVRNLHTLEESVITALDNPDRYKDFVISVTDNQISIIEK